MGDHHISIWLALAPAIDVAFAVRLLARVFKSA